ncbi:hypothetical protein [Nocardioides sp. GXZ039]|uniref:hypothetical protein n=1 Tax=Nocardioides sp. GXZ039 TaxID=3136018 RepID=UPI0030F4A42F
MSLVLTEDDWYDIGAGRRLYGNRNGKDRIELNTRTKVATAGADRLCVITTDDTVVAFGLATSGGRSGDLDHRLDLRHLRTLDARIPWADMRPAIGAAAQRHLTTAVGAYVVPPRAGEALVAALGALSDEATSTIAELLDLRRDFSADRSPPDGQLHEEQRDALALALEVAGFDSSTVLDDEEPVGGSTYLEGLYERAQQGAVASEASIIRHDAHAFEEWVPGEARILDAVEFQDPDDPARRLVTLYADKENMETVTGTDLVYYRVHQPGWVLVQYKRMSRNKKAAGGEQWIYRPDEQLDEEIERMRRVPASVLGPSADDWRLNAEPFWVKLVADDKARPLNRRLLPGMYFPLSYFERLLADPRILGPRGGRALGWHNSGRRIDNTHFTVLLRDGWIGSSGATTAQVAALVEAALLGDRTATVAIDYATT